jgi:CubicO group peptidase (beta-lactamase class C family)
MFNPGEGFAYRNVNADLLARILTEASGMRASEFGEKYLFRPLGISAFDWLRCGKKYDCGGTGLSLKSRDMAKIGYLCLKKGKWDVRQIVPEKRVEESTSNLVDTGANKSDPTEGYGYLWWTHVAGGNPAYTAFGSGGQYITIVPGLSIVYVETDGFSGNGGPSSLLKDVVIPSLTDDTPVDRWIGKRSIFDPASAQGISMRVGTYTRSSGAR